MSKEFVGLPITGSVDSYKARRVAQRPGSDLQPAIQDVLDLAGDDFVGFKWTQYIPGFNDGNPCVFSTGETSVRYSDIPEEEGEREDGWVSVEDQWVVGGAITVSTRRDLTPEEYIDAVKEWQNAKYNREDGKPTTKQPSPWQVSRETWHDVPTGVTVQKRSNADAVSVLADLIDSSAFDHALQDAFGDNAEVTLTKKGFTVDYYECGY